MSSFYEDASLVMIPSGYKTSKVYCAKPTDGTGDLTFTRSNDTATRVASSGLIEKVRTNSALQSQTFENASWTKNAGATITANTTTAPDGTLTAETLNVATTIFSGLYQVFTTSTNSWTTSLFVKKGTKDFIYLFDPTTNKYAWFNLTTGAVGQKTASTEAAMISVGSGWYRISVTASLTGNASHFVQFGLSDTDGSFTPASTGTAFIWGAQAEVSDFGATDYIPTTTAAVSVGPVANVPRLDYLNSTCPKLLLEPQRTNLLLYSEQFNNGVWTLDGDGVGQSLTANFAVSPDGYQNADRLQLNKTGGTFSRIRQNATGANTYTFSVYMKSNTGVSQNVGLRLDTIGANNVVTTAWQRFTLTATVGTPQAQILLFDSIAGNNEIADILIWGAQLEVGSYATSYIPTLAASVTRGEDACVKTGISSLIGQTEGTIFVEFQKASGLDTDNVLFSLSDGTSANLAYVSTQGVFEFITASATQAVKVGISLVSGTNKIATYYKANDFGVYLNGASIFTDTVGSVGAMSKFTLGCYFNNNLPVGTTISQALLFKTRLTNQELLDLTTL